MALRIVDLLPESAIGKCRAAVRELIHEEEVPDVVVEVSRLLPGPLVAEAVDAVTDLPARHSPRIILGVMAPNLPELLREGALKHLLSVSNGLVGRRAVVTQGTRVWPVPASDLLERIASADIDLFCLDGVRAVQRWWLGLAE